MKILRSRHSKTVPKIFFSVVLLILQSCGSPELRTLLPGATILAFGDSLTVGVGASTSQSYPTVLQALSGFTVHSAGISGETTAEGKLRLERVLVESTPDLVILLEGGNDILRNVPPSEIKANLRTMIQLVKKTGAEVVLVGVPEKNIFSNVAPIYEELANEHELVLMDSVIAGLLRSSELKSDPVHLNAAGYRALAEAVYDELKSAGAL